MYCSMYNGWFTADVLHDVHFTARRPPHLVNVRSQHPVILQLVIAPARASCFRNPLGSINARTVWTIELVAPDEAPDRGIRYVRCEPRGASRVGCEIRKREKRNN